MRPVAAERTDRSERAVRNGRLRTAASRVARALAVLAATASPCPVGATDAASAAPPADRLGESRLFFSAVERRGAGRGGAPAEPGADEPPRVVESPDASPATPPPEPRRPRARPDVTFQALLRVGDRLQALVDGRPCRARSASGAPAAKAGTEPTPLRCVVLPPGVRALAFDASAGQLVVTPERGRPRRLAVGERFRP